MTRSKIPQQNRLTAMTILILGFFLRIIHLTYQPPWTDEIDVFSFAGQPFDLIVENIGRPGHNGSLYYLIVHMWFSVTGSSLFALRYLSVLFGIITLSAVWGLGRFWFGNRGGHWLCMLMAISPYLVWYAQDGKMYSLVLAISALSTLVLLKALKEEKWKYLIAFAFLTWIGWYIHIFYVLIAPVHLIAWIAYGHKDKDAPRRLLLLLLLLIFLYTPFLAWEVPTWMSSFTTGHQYYGLFEIISTQLFVFAIGFPSIIQAFIGSAYLFLFIFGLIRIQNLQRHSLLLISYFILPTILVYLISLGMPVYTDRYLIAVATPFYAICAFGLIQLQKRYFRISGLVLLMLLLSLSTIYTQANTLVKTVP